MDISAGEFEEKSLAYDLRVFYAMIVGRKMIAIEDAADIKDYPSWFRNIDLLFKIVYSRVDKQRDEVKTGYEKVKNEALQIINHNTQAYFKKSNDARAISDVEDVLSRMQHYVYRVLHVSNQFGSNTDIKGLY